MEPPEFDVAGVRIHAIRVDDVVCVVDGWISGGRRDYVVLTGAHGIVEMQHDAELRDINNRAGLTTPDGMPVVWMGRLKGHPRIEKVYAPDIMEAIFRFGLTRQYRHFLYGGDDGVAERLRETLEEQYPGILVTGTHCPPFRPLEEPERREVARLINSARPDIVWVGLGCPKQERWMDAFRPHLDAAALIGVGAGFDFLAGLKPLAPRWIQHSGLEWFYRLLCEPRRLWPRYSRVVPSFVYYVARDWIRGPGRGRTPDSPTR